MRSSKPFVARLVIKGETKTLAEEVLDTQDASQASPLAKKFAREYFQSVGGVFSSTDLFVVHDGKSEFIDEWTYP